MRSNSASSASAAPQRSEPASNDFTRVELTHIQKRVEHWIRFGRPADEKVLDRRRRVLAFRPDSVFAFVRWAANDYGTIISRIDIVRAVAPGDPHQTLPFVRPGGDILLKITGWPKVEQVLRHIDAVERLGLDACDVAPDHWRHVGNRIVAGETPRPYTLDRHQAWLKRRAVMLQSQNGPQGRDDKSGEAMR